MWLFDPDESVDLGFVSPLYGSIIGKLKFYCSGVLDILRFST